jgi:4-hydroxy-3-polyprenylbenzoate decarboxylase
MPTATVNQTGNTAPPADTGKTTPHNQTGNVVSQEDSSIGNGVSTKGQPQGSTKDDSQNEIVEGFPFRDVRDYLAELEKRDMLVKVSRLMNKDTEIMPLVRWQFRGLTQSQRKGWLFDNVTDARGRKFDASVAVSISGASPAMYALEMGVKTPAEINAKWLHAMKNPVKPLEVQKDQAPVKEVIITGDDIVKSGGIDQFPVTVTNPGTDVSAYFSAPIWITKDPETGVYNVGTYRSMLKAADRAGCMMLSGQDAQVHWEKAKAMGKPLEAVLCLSVPPTLALCSASKMPLSEYDACGGIIGKPLEVVKAETVDLLIPAYAEIAFEGHLRTDILEMEGPFGEYGGYAGPQDYAMIFEVSAITHRKKPILQAFISEMPPSESSMIRKFGFESMVDQELGRKIPHYGGSNFFEFGGSAQVVAIRLKKRPSKGEAWNTLRVAASLINLAWMKWIIVVDEDIDISDVEMVFWAMAWRVQPHRDIEINRGRLTDLDPSAAPCNSGFDERTYPEGKGGSQILIDATLKFPNPPISLPSKDLMENAKKIWEELKLPELTPKVPWFGYELGYWPEDWDEATKLTLQGRYLETGEKMKAQRTKSSYFDTGKIEAPNDDKK